MQIDINTPYLTKIWDYKKKKQRKIPAWWHFSKMSLYLGWKVSMYKSKSTSTVYIYINKGPDFYKIRFSNHPTTLSNFDYNIGAWGHTLDQVVKEILKKI